MSTTPKWRVAHLDQDGGATERQLAAEFQRIYVEQKEPQGMAMFSHVDSLGKIMAVSITPDSVPYFPVAETWTEQDNPMDFGHVGWVAGDKRLKTL